MKFFKMFEYFYFLACFSAFVMEQFSCGSLPTTPLPDDEGAALSCDCGKGQPPWKRPLSKKMAADIFERIVDSNLDMTSLAFYPEAIVNYLKKCPFCEITYTRCEGFPGDEEYECLQSSAGFHVLINETYNIRYKDILQYAVGKVASLISKEGKVPVHIFKRETIQFPYTVHIPIGGLKGHRMKRHGRTCGYPTSLQTAELSCIHYPSKIKCIQRCAFGHTLRKLTSVRYTCQHSTDEWKPGNFMECKPYIDCTISLVSGGESTCTSPTLTKGPKCKISCARYEDHKAVGPETFRCNEDGQWSGTLPFCAVAGSGLELVEKPNVERGTDQEDEDGRQDADTYDDKDNDDGSDSYEY